MTSSYICQQFIQLAHIFNPSGQEQDMLQHLTSILQTYKPELLECDLECGIHFCKTYYVPSNGKKSENVAQLVLAAHTDSDHLAESKEEAKNVQFTTIYKNNQQVLNYDTNCDIGMDDKTGIAVILGVLFELEQYQEKKQDDIDNQVTVHVMFTVCEEVGQKGIIRANIQHLKHVQHVLVIDRMSNRHPHGKRHIVNTYCDVPLLVPSASASNSLLQILQRIDPSIDSIPSPNCSDAIEYRARFDAEIALPAIMDLVPSAKQSELKQVYQDYCDATSNVLAAMNKVKPDQRIGSFTSGLRYARYKSMRAVYDALYGDSQTAALVHQHVGTMQVANLSLDYDESYHCMSITELEQTCKIVFDFCCQQQVE